MSSPVKDPLVPPTPAVSTSEIAKGAGDQPFGTVARQLRRIGTRGHRRITLRDHAVRMEPTIMDIRRDRNGGSTCKTGVRS